MKLLKYAVGAGLLAVAPITAMAGGVGNTVDGYYLSSGIDTGAFDDDGDGFGVKGTFAFSDQLFFNAEYQSADYDDSNADLDQIRVGVGINSNPAEQIVFYGLAEYINLDDGNDDENGFGVHAGAIFAVNEALSLNARVGYVDVGDFDGFEWLVGGAYQFTSQFGAFIDYRTSYLEDGGFDLDIDDLRVGLRFRF